LGSSSFKVLALGFLGIFLAYLLNSFLCTYLFPFSVLISTVLYSLLSLFFSQIPPWTGYLFVIPAFLAGALTGRGKRGLWAVAALFFLFLSTPMAVCFSVPYAIGAYSLKKFLSEKRVSLFLLFLLSFFPFFSPLLLTYDPFVFLFATLAFQVFYSLVASFVLFRR